MKKYLPIFIVVLVILLSFAFVRFSTISAQDADSQTSDYALDVQQGEKDTANDVDAQNNQQDVSQSEETQAAADDGNPNTEPVIVTLDDKVAPEEAQESAKLVDNPQATTSENDNGAVLNDQSSSQNSGDKQDQAVNNQDDSKSPAVDPDTQPQASSAPQEQSMDSIQNSEPPSEGNQEGQ